MRRLILHPDSHCAAVTSLEARATRPRAGLLALSYVLRGATAVLALPPLRTPARADDLWRHTCFEVFVGVAGQSGYREFNLAPSTEWAAYRFDAYREGMRPAEIGAPRIEVRSTGEGLELQALLEVDLPEDAAWRVGLSAVIEEAGGGISYWALAHPPGRADFHHPDCFALELPATGRP
jgi:hypothetical protein